ncbi:MAG: AAA family ATPase [Lachnospiraceae bacterium]|nr:AAA family ATPase [Lachnospiraceae bacterium]
MITFNNTLDIALQSIHQWNYRNLLTIVTIVRDVYGKVSFMMDNTETVPDEVQQSLIVILEQNMGPYFSGRIYWKRIPHNRQNTEGRRIAPIINIIEGERLFWKREENIDFYVSERPIAKKAWIKTPDILESVWSYESAVEENGTKVVTFYSFKGGMGRTTALAGVALTLAMQGKNVMMVDTDIEAPGLATLFFETDAITKGVLDYLIEHEIDGNVNIGDYVLDVTEPALLNEDDGQIYLMPAGRVDRNYLQKLARIDYQDNRENHLKNLMTALLVDVRERYEVDYILIDARAGFHDMGGVAVAQLPHGAVLFGNDSRQSWDGLTQVLRAIAEGHTEDFPVMLVDTMCAKPTAANFISGRERFIQNAYTICVENYYDSESGIPGIEAEGEIHSPEFVPFNDELLHEVILYSDGSQGQNQRVSAFKTILISDCYKKIADRIKGWFGEE